MLTGKTLKIFNNALKIYNKVSTIENARKVKPTKCCRCFQQYNLKVHENDDKNVRSMRALSSTKWINATTHGKCLYSHNVKCQLQFWENSRNYAKLTVSILLILHMLMG